MMNNNFQSRYGYGSQSSQVGDGSIASHRRTVSPSAMSTSSECSTSTIDPLDRLGEMNSDRVPGRAAYHGPKINKFNQPRSYGDFSIEQIDDFLNPASRLKPPDQRHRIKFELIKVTSGRGIVPSQNNDPYQRSEISSADSVVNSDVTSSLGFGGSRFRQSTVDYMRLPLNERNKHDFSYIKRLRDEFESELKSMARQKINRPTIPEECESGSVNGSAHFGSIESQSAFSMSTQNKQRLMKMSKMIRVNETDEDMSNGGMIDDNNNERQARMHAKLAEAERDAQEKELDDDEKRERLFRMHLEDYVPWNDQLYSDLPIKRKRADILRELEQSSFIVIEGGTGCGKTTQVPQYILDECMRKKQYCNIVVTQPRRIAAISVARRVSYERGWTMPKYCGYQIGLDRDNVNEDTRITYMTTGVLLNKLIAPRAEETFLKNCTHIILDEVHERDLDTDFCLLVAKIKRYLGLKAKVILMSATIDTDKFREYFASVATTTMIHTATTSPQVTLVPRVVVPALCYEIQEFYWEDLVRPNSFLQNMIQQVYKDKCTRLVKQSNLAPNGNRLREFNERVLELNNIRHSQIFDKDLDAHVKRLQEKLTQISMDPEEPKMLDQTMLMCIILLKYFDYIETKSIRESADYHPSDEESDIDAARRQASTESGSNKKKMRIIQGLAEQRGSVLIFLPGMEQIKQLQELITEEMPNAKLNILPLHSDIVIDQQNQVFAASSTAWRKVILSTKIAESSITVPDIKYVIDFCLTKELYCEPATNYTQLRLEWASVSSMDQRRGRAGRVSNGYCYRLITRRFQQTYLETYPIPAILREPLEQIILNVKRLKQPGEPRKILAFAMQPPKLTDIGRTLLSLKEVGALTLRTRASVLSKDNTAMTLDDGDLTYAGEVMSNLPIDVRLTKLILLGHVFGKLREAIIIAAGLSLKTFFTCYYKSHLESYKSKWSWAGGWFCDSISILNAYNVYESLKHQGHLRNGRDRTWAKQSMIELSRIREVEKLKHEIESRLERMDIRSTEKVRLHDQASAAKCDLYNIDEVAADDPNHYLVLKIMLAGAFYPNYFQGINLDLKETMKSISFRDYHNTVCVKNVPKDEAPLYKQQLVDMFSVCSKFVQVHFEETKACIEFKSKMENIQTNINLGVYLAVQIRLLRMPLSIKRYKAEMIQEKLKRLRERELADQQNTSLVLACETFNSEGSRLVRYSLLNQSKCSLSTSYAEMASKNLNASIIIEADEEPDLNQTDTSLNESQSTLIDENTRIDEGLAERMQQFLIADEIKVPTQPASYMSIQTLNKNRRGNMIMSSTLDCSYTSESNLSMSGSMIHLSMEHLGGTMAGANMLGNPRLVLPRKVDENQPIAVGVIDIADCGLFWAQIDDKSHQKSLKQIHKILNSSTEQYQLKKLERQNLYEGGLCVAWYQDEFGKYLYRAEIIKINHENQHARIRYVDFGNSEIKGFESLYWMNDELKRHPYQAIQCRIDNIKPSVIKNPSGVWSQKSKKRFQKLMCDAQEQYQELQIKVSSIEDDEGVVLVDLFGVSGTERHNLADILIKENYAENLNSTEINLKMSKPRSGTVQNLSMLDTLYAPTTRSDFITKAPKYAETDVNYQIAKGQNNFKSASQTDCDTDSVTSGQQFDDNDEEIEFTHEDLDNTLDRPDSEFMGRVELRGPISPLEVSYHSIVNVGFQKRVRIERDSINYPSIDDDPTNESLRLMIASDVSLNAAHTGITVRKTTLMPKLPGLVGICCLLFSPFVEMRVDREQSHFTGALCGLGFDERSGMSMHPDNDIECAFDTKLDMHDLIQINNVRLAINMIIGNDGDNKTWTVEDRNLRRHQEKACNSLLKVVLRSRQLVEPTYVRLPYQWNQISKDKLIDLRPEGDKDKANEDLYYVYHRGVKLNELARR